MSESCPNCGYCPHCGRSRPTYPQPYVWPQPSWRGPYWIGDVPSYPTITCSSTAASPKQSVSATAQ